MLSGGGLLSTFFKFNKPLNLIKLPLLQQSNNVFSIFAFKGLTVSRQLCTSELPATETATVEADQSTTTTTTASTTDSDPYNLAVLANPQFINGTWRKARFGGRKIAVLRRKALEQGLPWPYPRREKKEQRYIEPGTKGAKIKKLSTRQPKIDKALKNMDKQIANLRESLRKERNKKTGFQLLYPFKIRPVSRASRRRKRKAPPKKRKKNTDMRDSYD